MSLPEDSKDFLVQHELTGTNSLETLELVAEIVPLLDPIIGQVAKLYVSVVRENRLEVEARLNARLGELHALFTQFEVAQAREVAERDRQFQALSILLDVAQLSGHPGLILEAMRCFQEYVRKTPTFTRSVTDLASAIQPQE